MSVTTDEINRKAFTLFVQLGPCTEGDTIHMELGVMNNNHVQNWDSDLRSTPLFDRCKV